MIRLYYFPDAAGGGFFHKVWAWLKKVFAEIKDFAPVAVSITEQIKAALDSGAVGFLAKVIDGLTHSQIAEDVIAVIEQYLPKVLAVELAIEGLPANPSDADIAAFEQRILAAFNVTDNKSKLYTTLAAQIYGLLKAALEANAGKLTFAQIVALIEQAYQDYLDDLNQQDDTNV